ncbi:nuclear transport factor 2 family protein [Acinetobacter schindleri]|uniref:SnoaL-like domain-containing protein n=1 Tax=Acinetobacter schindleri TaxID=108981 RepID=A0AAE6WX48_9GAMM|nr:nuclear transport factor 2 family protein [Acinetobacter schindleri]QIC67879.1 hypothetical protein FSC10_11145 [Acinetobacter schindleri]
MTNNKPTLSIQSEIEHLIKYFAYLNDQKRYKELIKLFTPHAKYSRPSQPNEIIIGHADILDSFNSRPKKITQHIVGNVFLNQQTDDLIFAESQILLFSGNDSESLEIFVVGGFKDKIIYQNDQWLFHERNGFIKFVKKI